MPPVASAAATAPISNPPPIDGMTSRQTDEHQGRCRSSFRLTRAGRKCWLRPATPVLQPGPGRTCRRFRKIAGWCHDQALKCLLRVRLAVGTTSRVPCHILLSAYIRSYTTLVQAPNEEWDVMGTHPSKTTCALHFAVPIGRSRDRRTRIVGAESRRTPLHRRLFQRHSRRDLYPAPWRPGM